MVQTRPKPIKQRSSALASRSSKTQQLRNLYTTQTLKAPTSPEVAALGLSSIEPEGCSIEKLVECLRVLPLEAQYDQLDFASYYQGSIEVLSGLFWAVKLEWGGLVRFNFPYEIIAPDIKSKASFKRSTKECGEWVQALLHLCEKVSTYAEAKHGLSLTSMTLLRVVLEDVVRAGGISGAINDLYEWEPTGKTYDSKKYFADLNSNCTRMKSFNKRTKHGSVFNAFVGLAIELAEKNSKAQKTVFKAFYTATRKYIKSVQTEDSAVNIRVLDVEGNLFEYCSAGKGRGMVLTRSP